MLAWLIVTIVLTVITVSLLKACGYRRFERRSCVEVGKVKVPIWLFIIMIIIYLIPILNIIVFIIFIIGLICAFNAEPNGWDDKDILFLLEDSKTAKLLRTIGSFFNKSI